ncbi:macrophage mannose receptor 1-like [Sceloporus undulatus]|uniref:macrophage mannose receptor 1-like n=1 Tax=Sceloporus undulatus TaxID=8520 RepID=UPI001C4CCDE1|nr:macrophage mannose receptor 1-like [Sceloporus undulatus]
MSTILLFSFLFLIQPAFQVSEPDTFLIYNEYLSLCMEAQKSHSITLESCNKNNEWQNFKWASEDLILNMATKLCVAAPSKTNLVSLTLSPCNKTSELQKWSCRNETFLQLGKEKLFLQPASGQKENVILSKTSTTKSTWTIFGTKDSLCSKGYEALFTLAGNSFGSPCVFPFKYKNTWHAKCIRDDDQNAQLWCGTTEDVDKDSLQGYCPVKDDNEFFWVKNQWTGDLYEFNSYSALSWHQARQSCEQQNAELLSITELHEQTYLTGLTSTDNLDYWIGLNNLDFDSGWQWTGDHPLRYLNWAPGNPSPESEKICGSMKSGNGKWENNKCEEKFGYICKRHNSSLDASVTPEDPLKPIKCKDGWVAYAGYCYHLHRELKTWKAALSSCRKADGDLISIHNIEEYSFVISQLGYKSTDLLWIGLNDQKTQMYFEWSDGTSVRFTKWQRGEPTHVINRQEDCVIMSGENGDWEDHYCEEELGYICKGKPLASAPEEVEPDDPNCQKGWKRHGFYCYFIGQTIITFSEAKTFCEANKASLTSVEDRYEQAYLTSLIGLRSERYFWIGLTDVKQPGTFNWTNGDEVLFTHWNSEMPGQRPGCVAMRTGTAAGLWDVVNCEEKAAFLCKQWAEGVTPPPVPPVTVPPPCPKEWHPSPTRNVCFKKFVDEKYRKKTWFEARDFCKEIGGDLASIHNEEEQNILYSWDHDYHYWIGLNTLDPDKGLAWSDESPVNFQYGYDWSSLYWSEKPGCKIIHRWYGDWVTYPCETFQKWICQIKRGTTLKKEPRDDFEYSFKKIEDGWIAYGSNEYYLSNITLPAEKAQEFCRKHGGGLTVIETETERKFLWKYNYFYGSYYNPYIGLILGLDGKFSWIDGSPMTYVSWAPNEPNFANEDEHCVMMYYYTGLWNDINCGAENGFICERHNSSVPSSVTPTSAEPLGGCPEGWHLFDNKCFRIYGFNEEDRKNWIAARADCKNLGGNLASISSKTVQAFLTVHLKSSSSGPWIGLNDRNWENRFLWTDGSGVYYTNWSPGAPRYNGDCVFMLWKPEKLAGYWRDGRCEIKRSYVCQRKTDSILPVSEATVPASGYTLYGNSSYSLVSPKMTWEDARKRCKSENSEIASIVNPYIQSFLWLQVLKYKEPVWIGLNSNLTNKKYKWISNQRLVYSSWGEEEPKENIACVYLDIDGHWKTSTCNETYFSICEKYHGIIPTDPPEVPGRCPESKESHSPWIPFRAHCYSFYSFWQSWPSASMRCAHIGGTLTSIEDLAEMNFLLDHTHQLSQTKFWIGLFKNVDGEWEWEDKTEVDFVNWKDGPPEPYNHSYYHEKGHAIFQEQCIFMNGHTGEWLGQGCYYPSKGFICKTSKTLEVPTAMPTDGKEHAGVRESANGTAVIAVILVMLILTGAGITAYIFYKRRRRQPQPTGGFENSMYNGNVITLQKDPESQVDKKEVE